MFDTQEKIVVAGDWHGNLRWANHVVRALPRLLPNEEQPLILQLGDFGIWPGGEGIDYLSRLNKTLKSVNARLAFVHGNHEDHTQLDALYTGPHPTPLRERIFWLPVNTRWIWRDRVWVAVGGATSVDKSLREEGVTWWAGEALTRAEADEVIASGAADVMVSHDAPINVPITYGPTPKWFAPEDLELSYAHRELLQEVVDEVRPQLVIHGHHHRWQYQPTLPLPEGKFAALSLAADGFRGNVVVLDLDTLAWHEAQL